VVWWVAKMHIGPSVSLALSVQAHKGIYALLLGSGTSRAAGIPTGWDIVKDLIQRLALLHEDDPGEAAEEWYRKKFKKEPSYSDLLDSLAPSSPERLSLLKSYFDPTEDERSEGLKIPTPAHTAIAHLVRDGYFRVIVTTNFDRLLEQALQSEGINPTIVSSPDHIEGMMPIPHVDCLLVKANGDYLDTRLKNTPSELEKYDESTNALLDRIFEEYGLIICGWSGEWDLALANAIRRNTRFRFSTFWMTRGKLSETGADLVSYRKATVIKIESADSAFVDLEGKINALDQQRLADPRSPRLAVSTMKKYLSESRHRIQLEDLVMNELRLVAKNTSQDVFPLDSPEPTKETYVERVQQMEVKCQKLVPMIATGVYWGSATENRLWKRCIVSLAKSKLTPGTQYRYWSDLRYYPATLLFYAVGLSALVKGRYDVLKLLLEDTTIETGSDKQPSVSMLHSKYCLGYEPAHWLLETPEKRKTPGSEWMAILNLFA